MREATVAMACDAEGDLLSGLCISGTQMSSG
jgi:hypothetical protein